MASLSIRRTVITCPENPKLHTPPEIEEKILYLRRNYHLGQLRISWYLKRYHGIKISSGGVYGVLKRNGLNRFSKNAKVPSWHDVKNLVYSVNLDKAISEGNLEI